MSLQLKDVILQVDGKDLAGWKDISITQSIEEMCNTFDFSASGRRGQPLVQHPVKLNASCRVLIGGVSVINGSIERLSPEIDADNHSIGIFGRDITADLVDSSAIIPNQELHNVTLKEAAELLCNPHNIKVDCPDEGEPFEIFAVNDGESVFDCIEQHARQRKFLVYTYGDGVLHIKKAVPIAIDFTLEDGVNFTNGSANHHSDGEFSSYIVKSQKQGGKNAIKASTKGTHPRKNRVLIVRPEKSNEATECKDRGQWEAKVRKAKARRATITLPGWEYANSKIWRPLLMPMLVSPDLMFNQPMVVVSVELHVDDAGGTLTTLELVDPDVYA